jgi:dTDP-4-amino-4,6-dideoxygalactose transaminase
MIPFNKPFMTGKELWLISQAYHRGQLSGDGEYTKRVHKELEKISNVSMALFTHSCTAALEMAAILSELEPGDEIILPSYTFVSTANAFVLRNAVPVFIDIRYDTLNLDESLIEQAITPRTRAIVPVHYAGVGCEMDSILDISTKYNLLVIEDAAQGIRSYYKDRPLGSIGDMGTYSFHETKNITCGEGGALLIQNEKFRNRAEIIREKGTNRSQFIQGRVDKYTWVDLGSSFLPGEMVAAFLLSQLEEVDSITNKRLLIWNLYHEMLKPLEMKGYLRRPIVPEYCTHNAHMYYIILNSRDERDRLMQILFKNEIISVFHYIPLHNSKAGIKYARVGSTMDVTERISNCLLRLPLFCEMEAENIEKVVKVINSSIM